MAVLSVVPNLGSFMVWIPAALVLALQGAWIKAAILAGWGVFVVGTIDNVLYPMLVGHEMRLHTLPVFLSILGGLLVFGAAGLVLGPVILAATVAILEILRRRTEHAHSAAEPA
jgi:predicted PurR-regulated permease PerM